MTALVTPQGFTVTEKQEIVEAVREWFTKGDLFPAEDWYRRYEIFSKMLAWSMYDDEDA